MSKKINLELQYKFYELVNNDNTAKELEAFIDENLSSISIDSEHIIGPAIMEAANAGSWDKVIVLFNAGASIDVKNSQNGWSFIHEAVLNAPDNLWSAIVDEPVSFSKQDGRNKKTPLMIAYNRNKLDKFYELLSLESKDLGMSKQDKNGHSIAHIVCIANDEKAIETLLQRKTTFLLTDNEGKLPLDHISDILLKEKITKKIYQDNVPVALNKQNVWVENKEMEVTTSVEEPKKKSILSSIKKM